MVREWGTVVQASKVMLTFSGPCWALPDSIGGQVTMKWPSAKKALLTAAESCVSWVWHRAEGFDAWRRSLRSMEAVPRVQLKLPRSPGIAARGPRRSSQVHLRNHPSSSARGASVTLLRSWKSLSDFSSFYAHPLPLPWAWKAGYAQACACAGLVGTYYATKPSLRVSRWQPSGNPPPSPLQTLRISSQTRQILENIARCIILLWPRSTRRRSVLRQ